jgi:hypothetical protein
MAWVVFMLPVALSIPKLIVPAPAKNAGIEIMHGEEESGGISGTDDGEGDVSGESTNTRDTCEWGTGCGRVVECLPGPEPIPVRVYPTRDNP